MNTRLRRNETWPGSTPTTNNTDMPRDERPISAGKVLALTKAAIKQNIARGDTTPGWTINLGHQNIADLPDEVINVFHRNIERYVFL